MVMLMGHRLEDWYRSEAIAITATGILRFNHNGKGPQVTLDRLITLRIC